MTGLFSYLACSLDMASLLPSLFSFAPSALYFTELYGWSVCGSLWERPPPVAPRADDDAEPDDLKDAVDAGAVDGLALDGAADELVLDG